MKVGTKLIAGFLAIIFLMWVASLFCISSYKNIHEDVELAKEDIIPGAIAMVEMDRAAIESAHEIMEYIFDGSRENEEKVQSALESLKQAGAEHLEHERHIGQAEKRAAKELMAKIQKLTLAAAEIIDLKKQGVSVDEILKEGKAAFHSTMENLIKQLRKHKAVHMGELALSQENIHKAHNFGVKFVLLTTIFTTVLTVVVVFLTTRSIVKPLKALHKGTEIIGSGSLDYKVGTDARDEIGLLSRAFDKMAEDLKETVISRDNLDKEVVNHKDAQEKLDKVLQEFEWKNWELDTAIKEKEKEIIERRRAEEQARDLKQRIEFILGAAKTGLDIIDSEFNIRYIDPGWEKMYGKPDGKKCYEYFRGQSKTCPGCGLAKILESKTILITEGVLPKENNRPVQITSIPFLNEKGEWLVAEVKVDITERKKMEQAQERFVEELTRSNTELEQFAYVASHDLQEPLRMIASYTQLLKKRYEGKLDSDADEFIGYVTEGIERMQMLIRDLLTLSRVGTRGKDFESIDCQKIFEQVVASLKGAIQDSGAVVTNDLLPTVVADDGQLGQLFQNLLANAIKFRDGDTPKIHISAQEKENEWVFSVQDNGIGIDPKHEERIFKIFQRLHSRDEYDGTGIGLAVCKKIAERHGGRIWVESEHKKGSTFYFTIPMKGNMEKCVMQT